MTTWDDRSDDAVLATLVVDAVADVEPDDALAALRARTRTPARRRWVLPTVGAAVVAAAVVTVIALVTPDEQPVVDPGPLSSSATTTPSGKATAGVGFQAPARVYWIGDTPVGPRLYRQTEPVDSEVNTQLGAADLAVTGPSGDPDYRSAWPAFTHVLSVEMDGGDRFVVDLTTAPGMSLTDRPEGLSDTEAALSVQQLVWTVTEGSPPGTGVEVTVDGTSVTRLLGQPVEGALVRDDGLDVLSHVILDRPSEGDVVHGDTLEFAGEAASFEGNVTWRLQRYEGMEVIDQGNVTAEGGDGFYPFSGEVDLTGVPAGRYTFMVWTDDPSGEGNSFTDSRVITVE